MIVFITRKYPPSVGGMENLSYHLTTTVAAMRPTRIIAWRGSRWLFPILIPYALARAVVWAWRGSVDAIHVGDVLLSPLGLLLRLITGRPVLVTAHGLDVSYRNPIYQAVIRFCLPRLDRVVCISTYARRLCEERGVDRARTAVVPVGIDPESFGVSLPDGERQAWLRRWGIPQNRRHHLLLAVGRMVPRKGFVTLVADILPRLLERRDDWACLLIGDGPERPRVVEEVGRHHLGSRVRLPGRVSQEELRAAYAAAELFLMPNVEVADDGEGFGLVILEARLSGLPVVAFGLQGIVDALASDGDESLVSPGDARGFVDAIDRRLTHPSNADERRARRDRVIATYAWERVARQFLDVIDDVGAHAVGPAASPSSR